MHRFFVAPEALEQERIVLSDEIVRHLNVLRLSSQSEILLLDGTGGSARCRIEQLDRKSGAARVLERCIETETAFSVTLMQALPKGDKMDLVLQKGTELGVRRFVPLQTERSVPRLAPGREGQRYQRWQRIVSEAARQSRRAVLPKIDDMQPLAEALRGCSSALRLMLWEEGSRPLSEVLPMQVPADAAVLVGPEGGFSEAEADLAKVAGFVPVLLGPRILRTETAGFAAATILQYLYGDLDGTRG